MQVVLQYWPLLVDRGSCKFIKGNTVSTRKASVLTSLGLFGFVLALLSPLDQRLDGTQNSVDGLLHLSGEPVTEDPTGTWTQQTQPLNTLTLAWLALPSVYECVSECVYG